MKYESRADLLISTCKFPVLRSDKQKTLESNGCVFNGQEALDNHEIDISKPCYCGRPMKALEDSK